MDDVVWTPSPEYVERANVTRFMRAHGIGSYDELLERSVSDLEWFWDVMDTWGGPVAIILLGLILIIAHVMKRRRENEAHVGMPPRSY